jgi:hypothetical protein
MENRYRIYETTKGYLAQEKHLAKNFWGDTFIQWNTIIFYRGTKEPFYFKTHQSALKNLLLEIELGIIGETNNNQSQEMFNP